MHTFVVTGIIHVRVNAFSCGRTEHKIFLFSLPSFVTLITLLLFTHWTRFQYNILFSEHTSRGEHDRYRTRYTLRYINDFADVCFLCSLKWVNFSQGTIRAVGSCEKSNEHSGPINTGTFLTICATTSFSKYALFHSHNYMVTISSMKRKLNRSGSTFTSLHIPVRLPSNSIKIGESRLYVEHLVVIHTQ